MTLLAQVGLVLGAMVAIGLFLRGPREHWWRPSDVVVVVIVLLMASTLDGASNQFRNMATQARNNAKVSRTNAEKAGWLGDPKLGDFVEWLRGELPPGSRFHLVMNPSVPGEMYQWTTYRLLPRLEVAERTTDWLVFVGTDPRKAGFRSVALTDRRTFAPELSVARIAR